MLVRAICRLRSTGAIALLALFAFACADSPTAPSSNGTLTVRFLDETTGQTLGDPLFGIVARAAGPVTREQTAANGVAVLTGLAPGTYTVTATVDFGYVVLDVIPVTLATEGKTIEFRLKPIDDLIVTGIVVDGQGSIPRGGTIDVPATGITWHFSGRYYSPTSPWPALNFFRAETAPSEIAFGVGQRTLFSGPRTPTEWEYSEIGWKPCRHELGGNVVCSTRSDSLYLIMATPSPGRGIPGTRLRNRYQPWPLTLRLAPDCCPLP